jgi:hypothetical protein
MCAALVSACATTPREPVINTVIQKVEIPISVPCKAETPILPEFNFDKLTEEDTIFDKVKAILADRVLRDAYEEELRIALKSCK